MNLPDPNLKPVILELTGETVYLPLFGKGFVIWGAGSYDPYYNSIPIKGVEQIPGHQGDKSC